MTKKIQALIIGLAFLPITAKAQIRDANSLLRGPLQALKAAGFAVTADVQVPPAPAAAVASQAPANDVAETLAALVVEAQKEDGSAIGETVRVLGFDFAGDPFPMKSLPKQKAPDADRFFAVTTFRGKTEIIMSEARNVAGRIELRSYLITPQGDLEAAAVTTKPGGVFHAEKVPLADAQAGFQELLWFWTQYYRDNLKKP